HVVFKAECSAVTAEAVQIQGVWTDPALRGEGRATRAMAELCHSLLKDTGTVTLFVNDFNLTAIHVYERVGFCRIGTMRSVLF
ncbi:MAG: GNAT family N-acetyltransferase, partial [Candidatus Dormibacteria bacterium]